MMINRASSNTSPEIPHCLATNTQDQPEMTQFSQHSQQPKYFSLSSFIEKPPQGYRGELLLGLGSVIFSEFPITRPIKTDPGLSDFGTGICPPPAMDPVEENFRKRKADNKTFQPSKEQLVDENKVKKAKRCVDEKFASNKLDVRNNNSDNYNNINGNTERKMKEISLVSSKDNQTESEVEKLDYIHVRARHGQATDSHSLAERIRREKISERMKCLQDLVPGCNKITGKAGMLDEIINYVQSLQQQVEFLSMKLTAINPSLDFNIEDLFAKEAYPTCSSNIHAMGVSTEMANLGYLDYNSGQVCGSDLGLSEAEMSIRQSTTVPVSVPEAVPEAFLEAFLDSSCLTSCFPWEQSNLQNIYNMEFQQAGQQSFPSQTYTDLAGPF